MASRLIILWCLVLHSCISSTVTSFYSPDFNVQGQNFFLSPSTAQTDSLEFNHYADIVSTHITKLGAQRVHNISEAHYIISFDYGVKKVKGSKTKTAATAAADIFTAMILGQHASFNSYHMYERYLKLNIRDRDSKKKILESTVTSLGESNSFNSVSDKLFKDFFINLSKKKQGTVSYGLLSNNTWKM